VKFWPEGEAHAGADQPRPEADRQGRSPPIRGRSPERGVLHAVSCSHKLTAPPTAYNCRK
jgi:hypothetical protein